MVWGVSVLGCSLLPNEIGTYYRYTVFVGLLSSQGSLGFLPFVFTMENAVMNVCVHVCVWTYALILLGGNTPFYILRSSV